MTLYGMNPVHETITRVQHEQDMRRANEFQMVHEARKRAGSPGFILRIFGRLSIGNDVKAERVSEHQSSVSH